MCSSDSYKDNLHIFLTVTCMLAVKMISTFSSVIFATLVSTLFRNIYSTFFFYACSTNSCLKINDIYNHPLSGPLHSLANKKGNSLCYYTAYKLSLLEPNELITSLHAFEKNPLAKERICSVKSAFNYTYFREPTDQFPLCCFYLLKKKVPLCGLLYYFSFLIILCYNKNKYIMHK